MTSFVDDISHHISLNFNQLYNKINSPLFRKRYLVFNTITYISTHISNLVFTNLSPFAAIGFIHVAYLTSRVFSAIFAALLEPFRTMPYVPECGRFASLYLTLKLTKKIFVISGFVQPQVSVIKIGAIFLFSVYCTNKLIH